MIGSDNILGTVDVIIVGSTTIGDADRNTIRIDEGTDMSTLDISIDGSNEGKPVGLLFG